MDRADLLAMFRTKASEVAEKDLSKVDDVSVIANLGIDSLAMLEVVGEMERSLGVTMPDDLLVGIQTVGQLLDIFEKRQASAPATH
jgi:acyl carrier protein